MACNTEYNIFAIAELLADRMFYLIKVLGNGKRPQTMADSRYLVRHVGCEKEFVITANELRTGKKCPCCGK